MVLKSKPRFPYSIAFNPCDSILRHKEWHTVGVPDIGDILADRSDVINHAVHVPMRPTVGIWALSEALDGVDMPRDEIERRRHVVRDVDERLDAAHTAVG
jgi:hypothetical protein